MRPMTEDDYNTRQTLLDRVKNQKDEKSWEEFVNLYKNYIFLICIRMGLKHHDAEEVQQTVLVKVWDNVSKFDYDSNKRFRGWLCTVTGNCVKDFVRKQSSKKAKMETSNVEPEVILNTADKPEIEKIAEVEWRNYVANLAFNKIKDRFSEKVMSIFGDIQAGGKRTDIANKYNLPVNTISVYKARVISELCKEIRLIEDDLV